MWKMFEKIKKKLHGFSGQLLMKLQFFSESKIFLCEFLKFCVSLKNYFELFNFIFF
jgi:hypothetical protein